MIKNMFCHRAQETKDLYDDELFDFLSRVHSIQRHRIEHELEVLLKLFSNASAMQRSGGGIDWTQISQKIMQTKPDCADYLPTLISFVEKFGGGSGAGFIEDLAQFHRKFVRGKRIVGGSFSKRCAMRSGMSPWCS